MILFDQRIIGYIKVFERVSRANVKDCFEEDGTLIFVVQPGQASKAIGKGGDNIKRVAKLTNKKIRVIEFNNNIKRFVLNLLYPTKPELEVHDKEIIIKTNNNKEKGLIFGREKTRLKKIQTLVNKYFKITIKVE